MDAYTMQPIWFGVSPTHQNNGGLRSGFYRDSGEGVPTDGWPGYPHRPGSPGSVTPLSGPASKHHVHRPSGFVARLSASGLPQG